MTAPVLMLHRKLAQILYEAERIPKNGQAPREMGGYRFVQVGDAADFIRKALAEKVLTMVPTAITIADKTEHQTKSGGSMTTVDLIVDWTITDGESGETIIIKSFGAGADGGDKYSGKAMTSAMKYAFLAGFLLSTGEDTEGSSLPERGARSSGAGSASGQGAPSRSTTTHDGSLIGVAEVGKAGSNADFEPRQSEEHGWVVAFRLKQGRSGFKVYAYGPLAVAVAAARPLIEGQTVNVWGTMRPESFVVPGTNREQTYQVVDLERLVSGDVSIPAAEAQSVPAFSEEELGSVGVE